MKLPRMTQQFFTDVWKDSPPGFYVEIGAWDGRKKNSTIILEKAGWDGVCIEPTPESYNSLIQNRKCRCLNVAVYDKEGEIEFARFPDRPEWNGIIETYDESHTALLRSESPKLDSRTSAPAEVIKVKCLPWNKLDLPSHIDYLQIDVEGAEMSVMSCIDWTNTNITYICLEDNASVNGDMTYRNYMQSLGYEIINQQHVDFLWKKL